MSKYKFKRGDRILLNGRRGVIDGVGRDIVNLVMDDGTEGWTLHGDVELLDEHVPYKVDEPEEQVDKFDNDIREFFKPPVHKNVWAIKRGDK